MRPPPARGHRWGLAEGAGVGQRGHDGHRWTAGAGRAAGAELVRERGVRDGARGVRPIGGDRLAVARGLGQPHAARDHGLVDQRPEMAANLGGDLGGQVRPAVVHRQQDAVDRERGVQVVANEVDRGEQLGQSFQGVVLALERDEHGIGGGQGIHGQQTERRRAVDEDVVVAGRDIGDQAGEAAFSGFDAAPVRPRPRPARSRTGSDRRRAAPPPTRRSSAEVVDDRVVDRTSRSERSRPKPLVALPWGSRSMTRTRSPAMAR